MIDRDNRISEETNPFNTWFLFFLEVWNLRFSFSVAIFQRDIFSPSLFPQILIVVVSEIDF